MKRFTTIGCAAATLALSLSFGSASAADLRLRTATAMEAQPVSVAPRAHRTGVRGLHGATKTLIGATATATGLTTARVETELRSGKSLAQIAQANGKAIANIIQAARTTYASALAQAVTAGRLTQAQADAALTSFDQNASQIVNDTTVGQHIRSDRGRRKGRGSR